MKYMVNARKRRKSGGRSGGRKRRTAAQRAATRKMLAANRARRRGRKRSSTVRRRKTSTTRRSQPMARKRGRKRATARRRTSSTRRRRSSGARRRSPVTRLRRNTVYVTNPRRRRGRRRRYSSNPRILSVLKQGAKDAGATLAGGAIARMASGFLPSLGSPYVNIAAQLALGAGIGVASRKVVNADTARFITAGAMQVPLKNLITTFVPQAGAFLGDYDNIGSYALPGGNGVSGYMDAGGGEDGMSGYEEDLGVADVGY